MDMIMDLSMLLAPLRDALLEFGGLSYSNLTDGGYSHVDYETQQTAEAIEKYIKEKVKHIDYVSTEEIITEAAARSFDIIAEMVTDKIMDKVHLHIVTKTDNKQNNQYN